MKRKVKVMVDFVSEVYKIAGCAADREKKGVEEFINCSLEEAFEDHLNDFKIIESVSPVTGKARPMESWEVGVVTGNILARNYVQQRSYARDLELFEIREQFLCDARDIFKAARALGGATYATFKCRILRDKPIYYQRISSSTHPISYHIPIRHW